MRKSEKITFSHNCCGTQDNTPPAVAQPSISSHTSLKAATHATKLQFALDVLNDFYLLVLGIFIAQVCDIPDVCDRLDPCVEIELKMLWSAIVAHTPVR